MRAGLKRKLAAYGYQLGRRLSFPNLEALCIEDRSGKASIYVSNSLLGPAWPQIYKTLEQERLTPELISFPKNPAVLVLDSDESRRLLGAMAKSIRTMRKKEVHLEGVGFVNLETKSKPEIRRVILPLLATICIVTLGSIWNGIETPGAIVEQEKIVAGCIVDSSQDEFQSWLTSALQTQVGIKPGQQIQISTGLGELNVDIESTIGSAAKITGSALCSDGRELVINHRVDTSGAGAVMGLGQ